MMFKNYLGILLLFIILNKSYDFFIIKFKILEYGFIKLLKELKIRSF